jgi:transposase
MKVQEVLLRAMSGELKWWEAAEIIGVTDRTMRRWRERLMEHGYDGLFHRQRGQPSPKRIALATLEQVLHLYREQYLEFNVRHFHEKLEEVHDIHLSYTWVKLALQGAGLVALRRRRSAHRQRRPRRPLPGMLLHIDASTHHWLARGCWHDLLVILDDATSEIYYAQLVEEESTRTVLAALREVVEKHGVFCALYCDRASHFFVTQKGSGKVDRRSQTQVGRALAELGIEAIAAYSPQARGRSERNFGTWQGRLPQELRIRGIQEVEAANHFLRAEYMAEFNRKFSVPAEQAGSAFVKTARQDLEWIFSLQHSRKVNRDNTVVLENQVFQIEHTKWRNTLAGCTVVVHELLDGTIAIRYGPHLVGRYNAQGHPLGSRARKAA